MPAAALVKMKGYIKLLTLLALALLLSFQGFQSEGEFETLKVNWELEKNFERNNMPVHQYKLTLTNVSASTLKDNWALYWNQAPRRIISVEPGKKLTVRNINGDFYQVLPQAGFRLAPGRSVMLEVLAGDWMIKEADAPVGLYLVVVGKDGKEVIRRIGDYTLGKFERPEQLTRFAADEEPVPTPSYLFDKNRRVRLLGEEDLFPFLPSPVAAAAAAGRFTFEEGLKVSAAKGLEKEAAFLVAGLGEYYQVQATLVNEPPSAAAIHLKMDNSLEKAEAYELQVNGQGITIAGKDPAGVFYGIQSLLASVRQESGTAFVPAGEILDYPAFPYRGFHLDVGRNFQSKETILRVLDLLALFKLNKFLFYFTEDEGWRLAIEELPELTQVSSRRGHTLNDSLFLQPAYGSGPFADDPASYGNGHYTREDFKEIIRYAHDRHIEVIPTVNLPGHARAAIKAMEYRYHRLMKEGKEQEAWQYRLIDPDDASVYRSAQNYTDNTACVCRDQVYDFYETVLDDIIEMYEEAAVPLRMIHAGGDEVPGSAWKESPVCRAYLKDHPEIKDTRNLQAHFFDRLTRMIAAKGLSIGGWEEVVMEYDDQNEWRVNPSFTDRQVYPYIWNNLWGQQDLGYRIANRGYPVVLCPVTNFYFDLAYDKDPREPGLYWAGFNDTWDAFICVPGNLFLSTTDDDMGKKYDPEVDFRDMERLTPAGRKNIAGLQGQLWSETVKGREMLEYYILPKILGFAQRAWQGDPAWAQEGDAAQRDRLREEDWNRFINTAGRRALPMLDKLNGGYAYRLPAPGIHLEKDSVFMNAAYPGLEIRYTTDGSEPDSASALYRRPFAAASGAITAKCFNRQGRSGFSSTLIKETRK